MLDLRSEQNVSASQAAAAGTCQDSSVGEQAAWMRTALHDLAQPLTTLECVLFLSTLEPKPDVQQMRQAIDDALAQCRRMTLGVRAMQDRLHDGG